MGRSRGDNSDDGGCGRCSWVLVGVTLQDRALMAFSDSKMQTLIADFVKAVTQSETNALV